MHHVIELLKNHVSVRKFKDQPVDDQLLQEIIEAGQHASTSNHIQAYTIIRVKDKGKRRALAKLAGNQSYVEECPVFLVFCADLNRLGRACKMNNKKFESGYTENFILATVDTSLAAQNIMTAAESVGLGGVYIGALRNNPEDVCYLLNIPHNVYPVFGMCLGYPEVKNSIKPRLPLSLVFKEDSYTLEGDEEILKNYDASIRDYYIERTNGVRSNTWTEGMSSFLKDKQRPHMKEFLKNKGFEMI
ncbi:oxygen-insensitive NADPH nitroreductase [Pelosinus sp. UFO1]|uniref:oxygen-insensitive NADPH nitroreductase n=1 Tax=Pelosinus sp. UFO1 TaxID=484770 RepID=UPI0004D0E81F|nr:oxygen-insensitive NADPH nitroreductase [Pelosinus sp. UFO1]AIF49974.1 nitroreductase [Pelosinus sp. UFO1]